MSIGPPSASFPYMFWAHTEAFLSPFCLSQSGMPAPAPELFAQPGLPDLGPPAAEALPALERRLATLFDVEPERVVVVPGASGGMFLAAMRFFPGARVITEIPSYEPFRALPARFAAESKLVERRPENGWLLDPRQVASALGSAAEKPAHLFLSTPHNPTGQVLSADALVELAGLAARSRGVLVSNEIYMEFAPPAARVHAFQLAPNALSIGSLTKAYGLGPLRIGWILLGEGLRDERERLIDLAYLAWVDPPTVALRAALAALDHLEILLQPVRRFEHESRPILERWLAACPAVEGALGPFGLTSFPRVKGVEDTHALQRHLASEWGVDVVPGEFFGRPGHVRMGFAVPEATLREGLERFESGVASYLARSSA